LTSAGEATSERMRSRFPVAVHIFLLRENEVLLLRRQNTGYEDGKLSVVAGHVESGETVTRAALREIREEVGLALDPARLKVVGVMHRKSDDERVDFFLACRLAGEVPRNCEPGKCAELLWARLADLPEDTIPYVRAALGNYRRGVWFEEFGWQRPDRGSTADPEVVRVEIRKLQAGEGTRELVALSRAFFSGYEAHHESFFRIDSLSQDGILAYFSSFLEREDRAVFVALEHDRIVGYITVLIETQSPHWQVKRLGHISGLMVHRAGRRAGIGGRLLDAAKGFFREQGVKYYTVYTAVENRAAVEFYGGEGLEPLHIHFLGEISG
jgi:8-oxo-dGTP diphosphatase